MAKFTRWAAGTPRLYKRKLDAADKLGFDLQYVDATGEWVDDDENPVWPGTVEADDVVKVGYKYFHFRLNCGGEAEEVVKCKPNGGDGRLSMTFADSMG